MAEATGHAKALEAALSFRLLRNEDLVQAIKDCGEGSGPEEHLARLLDSGRIPERAAAFLSMFMAEVRTEAPHPSKELTEAAKELLIEPDRLEMVWGARVTRIPTGPLPVVAPPPPPPPPPVEEERPARSPLRLIVGIVVVLLLVWLGVRVWLRKRAEEEAVRQAEESLKRAEGLIAPVRKAIEEDRRTVGGEEARSFLGAVEQAEKIIPNNVSYMLLEARLREALGQEQFTAKAYDRACAMKPQDPSALAARGLWEWRRWLRVRAFPWTEKDLRGMRACRRTGDANDLEASATSDMAKAGQARSDSARDARDSLLLGADKMLRAGKAEDALRELRDIAAQDGPAHALRSAAHLASGDIEGAVSDADSAIEHDGGPSANEVRALARWTKGVFWRWEGCDRTMWKEKAAPLIAQARADWKAIPFDRADLAPVYDAARCLVELADGGVTRGMDPTAEVSTALQELESVRDDADARALSAQAHLCLAEWRKAAGQDANAEREKVAEDLAAAEKVDAKRAEVLIARGRWEKALGRDAEARMAWEAAKAAAPDDPRPDALLAGRR